MPKKKLRKKILKLLQNDCTLALLAAKESLKKEHIDFNLISILDSLSDDDLKFIYSDSNPGIEIIESTSKIKAILEHSTNTAFYAYNLAKNSKEKLDISEETIFLLGLLDNISSILIASASEETYNFIKSLCDQYGDISQKLYELFTFGNALTFINFKYMEKI